MTVQKTMVDGECLRELDVDLFAESTGDFFERRKCFALGVIFKSRDCALGCMDFYAFGSSPPSAEEPGKIPEKWVIDAIVVAGFANKIESSFNKDICTANIHR